MQYFKLFHLGGGITSNNFTHAWSFLALGPASCLGPQRAAAQVSPKNLPRVSLTVGCVVGVTPPDERHCSVKPWEKQAAYIRISLLAYCTYTLCQIKFRLQAMLSLFLICTFFLYVHKPNACIQKL